MFGKKSMFNETKVEFKWNNAKVVLETGKLARQATGAVWATMGETKVLATVVAAKKATEGQDFFPLTVDYAEKYSSVGRLPGGFKKREGRPSDDEILVSRLIDRPIRPLFPETFFNEVQLLTTVYAYDGVNSPDILALIAASACLSISGVPFMGPIGAVRVGYINNEYVFNPTPEARKESALELVVAGTSNGVLMVESEAKQLNEDIMLGAVKAGFENFQVVIKNINDFAKKAKKEAWEVPARTPAFAEVMKLLEKKALPDLTKAYKIKDKLERQDAVAAAKEAAKEAIAENEELLPAFETAFFETEYKLVRGMALNDKKRIDGRKLDEVRPIECEVDILPTNHGSSLFTRGETQSLATLTLATVDEGQMIDDIYGIRDENFLLHYNFPAFSVGEISRRASLGRRELGHGKLGWRALHPVLPSLEEFGYTIKITSDILESNGSSSMATVCAGCMALMAGGVQIKAPVAGIAMGLIKEGNDYVVLSDIMGDEDHLGDMDFKVAGSKEGITSLQMDIKITSITFEIMEKALKQARDGRIHILGEMAKAIKAPRKDLSKNAPQIEDIEIPAAKVREVIGSGGSVIKKIQEDFQVTVNIDDKNVAHVASANLENLEKAVAFIKGIFAEPEVGQIYTGEVVNIQKFGAFVRFFGQQDGLVHISEFGTKEKRVDNIETVVKLGDKLKVKYLGKEKGKTKLQLVK